MENEAKEAAKKNLKEGIANGRWLLSYTLVNELKQDGFSGRLISSYKDPRTGKARHLFNADGNYMPGYMIDKVKTILTPAEEPWHLDLIDWLVGHPEVGIQNDQLKIDEKYIKKKVSNPRITLVNLDHQSMVDLDQEDYIDKLIGRISLDTGKLAISLEKLRFILSHLNMEYRIEKFITNPSIEKSKLRKKLKDFVRSSYENAEKVNEVLENLDRAKYSYQIKEMLRLEIVVNNGGIFAYRGNPLGASHESIIKNFIAHPDLYAEMIQEMYAELKS